MINNNPERIAWLVTFGAFIVFLSLCALVPLGTRQYLLYTTITRPALLEVVGGTVRVQERGASTPLAVTKTKELNEGSVIETDENSRGILTFLDGSTAILFPDTQISLAEMRAPAFSWSQVPFSIGIEQTRGRVRIGAAPLFKDTPSRNFQINTPHLLANVSAGSYAIDVDAQGSQVTVRDGTAQVSAQARTVIINRGQRTVATRSEPPLPALPAAQDLIVNGDFKDPLARGWSVLRDSGETSGNVQIGNLGDRIAIQIGRGNSRQTSAITGGVQPINKEVSDFRTMRLLADVRVHSQSLGGGGILSSEYPLILRLRYRDVYGSEAEWVHGFYIQNTANNPTNNGELIPADVWIPFESGNLLETLDPKPFQVTSIQIYASGWDYESYVTAIRLIVE